MESASWRLCRARRIVMKTLSTAAIRIARDHGTSAFHLRYAASCCSSRTPTQEPARTTKDDPSTLQRNGCVAFIRGTGATDFPVGFSVLRPRRKAAHSKVAATLELFLAARAYHQLSHGIY